MRKPATLAAILLLVGILPAQAFDYARYQVTDLDQLMAQKRPKAGVDLYPARPLKLKVVLAGYAEGCESGLVKRTMVMADIPKDQVDALAISRCIKIRSPKGKELRIFIQDVVADFLPKEVPLGSSITLYAVHLFTGSNGPGLLVNEFSTSDAPPSAEKEAEENGPPCGCGSPDFHPGMDFSNGVAGATVRARDDGTVIKVEQDDASAVDIPRIGRCGRYIVIKHSYPNGHVVFTRYAQLGRVIGSDGQPLAPGAHVTKHDKIGEVGSSKVLHFEVRPADPAAMENGEVWTARYGADPTMEWSRYPSVDPKNFDFDAFGGKGGK
jgi:hypothetical protein